MRRPRVLSKLLGDRSGSTAVEFALVIPVCAMFIFGIWYMGWALNCGSEARHAVELASRIYITNPNATTDDLKTAITSHLQNVAINAITVTATSQSVGTATIQHITWSYQTTAPIPFISQIPISFGGVVDVPLATP